MGPACKTVPTAWERYCTGASAERPVAYLSILRIDLDYSQFGGGLAAPSLPHTLQGERPLGVDTREEEVARLHKVPSRLCYHLKKKKKNGYSTNRHTGEKKTASRRRRR